MGLRLKGLPDAFDEFWALYPRKVAVGAARKAYLKALRKDTHDNILLGISQQVGGMSLKERRFIPHASTWLNQERWMDEPEPARSDNSGVNTDATTRAIAFAGPARRAPSADCF